jgi:hypothetical protein
LLVVAVAVGKKERMGRDTCWEKSRQRTKVQARTKPKSSSLVEVLQ